MRAVVLYGKGDVKVGDFPLREVGENDVKVAVEYCGLCGTDFHKVMGRAGSRPIRYPVPLGHEISGYVAEVGSAVRSFSVGDPVTVDPNYSCGECYYCRSGRSFLCDNSMGVVKGMAEFVVAPSKNVYHIPSGMDMKAASLCEPLACCLHGIELMDIRQGESVALVGMGAIGAMMLQLLRLSGAGKILVIEPKEERRELAMRLGADEFVSPDDTDRMKEMISKGHYARVIECVGNSMAQQTALDVADRGATVVFFGVSDSKDRLSLNTYEAFVKELTIKTSYINPHTTQRAIELLASSRIDTESIFSAELSMEEAVEELLSPKHSRFGKTVVRINNK